MNEKIVITIGRQYGSGGHQVFDHLLVEIILLIQPDMHEDALEQFESVEEQILLIVNFQHVPVGHRLDCDFR